MREGAETGACALTLVLFGTKDRMIPPEMGRLYCEKLSNRHLILVYDAGHEKVTTETVLSGAVCLPSAIVWSKEPSPLERLPVISNAPTS
jgi:hypothetical protein